MFDTGNIGKHFSETYAVLFSPLTIFIWAICIVMATLTGPFGTYDVMLWPVRTLYWGSIATLAVVLGFAVRATAVVVFGFDKPLRFDLFAAVLFTVIFAPVVRLLRDWLDPGLLNGTISLGSISLNTFVLALAVFVFRRVFANGEPGHYTFLRRSAQPPEPRLMRRLSPENRGDILRLSANDHFVEVVTSKGVETLRMRLTDAIEEMDPIEGYCTHRSHWVARAAVTGTERKNAHKIFVLLRNGDKVPVSRKYRPDVEKAGIIPPAPKNGSGSRGGQNGMTNDDRPEAKAG